MKESVGYTESVTLTPTGVGNTNDKDFKTKLDFRAATQQVTFTFGSQVAFDRLWIRTTGLSQWTMSVDGTVEHTETIDSHDGIDVAFAKVDDTGGIIISFTFTRDSEATIASIYEIMMLPLLFHAPRPMVFRPEFCDPGENSFRSQNSTLISYAGLSDGKRKYFVQWDYLPKEDTDMLESIWLGPPIKKPFIFYPEPTQYPDRISLVRWQNDFYAPPSGESVEQGFSVPLELEEV